ncbi:AAA domain-containing protein [Nocardia acidivorans]|uniref:AAA domain-containing protein n=1 Tax=Nocardia acidivorans TaxID=404580 RepID=UPI0008318BF3|nr:AAA domain-containing protein [Nocardia acidivorans]
MEIRSELTALRAIPAHDADRVQERTALVRKISDLEGFAKGLVALLGDVRDQVVHEGRLIAFTAHQVVLKESLRRKDLDVIVIDEASMITAAMTMLVAGVGVGHTIVAGDFRQLPPIVQSAETLARGWLGQSAFEKSGIAKMVSAGRTPANLVALEYHPPCGLVPIRGPIVVLGSRVRNRMVAEWHPVRSDKRAACRSNQSLTIR